MAKKIDKNDLSEDFVPLKKGGLDFSNMMIDNWKVLGHKGGGYWLCECQCDKRTRKIQRSYDLKNRLTTNCGCERHEDLSGKTFGRWAVLKYTGNQMWLCKCQCKKQTVKEVKSSNLKNGKSLSCGCLQSELAAEHMRSVALSKVSDFVNKIIGDFKIKSYCGNSYWNVTCIQCGKEKVISTKKINNNPYCNCTKLKYKVGDIVNALEIIRYDGNKGYKCKCKCGKVLNVRGDRLTSGDAKSCGCLQAYYKLVAYGISEESANILLDKDKLVKIIESFKDKPTLMDISNKLNIKYQLCVRYIAKYNLHNLINIKYNSSYLEDELYNIIKDVCEYDVLRRCKNIINPQELDIYIPEMKIAFEFNGDYWHSDELKDSEYHQKKTITCAKKGIRLVHIFEHEWIDIDMHDKLVSLIQRLVCNTSNKFFGRDTYIQEIDSTLAKEFCDKYHMQSYTTSKINIGCFANESNRLLGVMTFGKPRFNHDYEYELIRLCWDNSVNVVGGTERLFKYFINKYNPNSILTYCDISKFTGNIYTKLGFNVIKITKPNYVWVHNESLIYVHRYRTTKAKLVENGLGAESDTEDSIMKNNGYLKVYDSGNLLLSWRK